MHDFWQRVVLAFRCWFSILFHQQIPEDIVRELVKTPPPATAPPAPAARPVATAQPSSAPPPSDTFDRAVQMLALLQRDGRLIDFLREDVAPFPDAQLGAAVRTVHESCRQVLDRYVKLEPILPSEEDQPVTLQTGFDPATIKLIGNVTSEPPVRGFLRHRGWRVKEVNLPSLPQGTGRSVVAPAEVEIP